MRLKPAESDFAGSGRRRLDCVLRPQATGFRRRRQLDRASGVFSNDDRDVGSINDESFNQSAWTAWSSEADKGRFYQLLESKGYRLCAEP
ncbi:MAG: hypothetical protein ACLSDO_01225 [Anaerotruncus colihominis]